MIRVTLGRECPTDDTLILDGVIEFLIDSPGWKLCSLVYHSERQKDYYPLLDTLVRLVHKDPVTWGVGLHAKHTKGEKPLDSPTNFQIGHRESPGVSHPSLTGDPT